ncbi:hypothetical protein GUJ93_ZPchr0014g46659 [Zizania palustris]|uniref:Uncharacterized protein n=1 Tax=Zizania palustris TaxID=103762 RepID=A0A8J5TLA0_ZIZPA|nr:hypothetical protein GUJ93_ZPchr0014g46659 [Zizania palustris]KAG8082856.1 hypothetical protein GUJ93_ZPchr0014g46659 [Zizania palustris]
MYRSQFSSDRSNDHTTVACRPGRSGGTHHWVVSGGRGGSASSATRPRSPCNQSRRPGRVQQYRPRSPASAVSQGNAISYTPSGTAAAAVHTQPASQGSTPSNVPDKSDAMNLESAQGERAADSSIPTEGCSSAALTLQFGTLSPGVINKQCTPCTTSPPVDLDGQKHEKEQQKQEATDDLIIGGQTDSINKCDNVYATVLSNICVEPELELPETPVRNYIPPSSKECNSSKVLPQSTSSPTRQQSEIEETTKDATNANQSDTSHKYPVTKPKISVQIPASYTPNVAPPSFMLPVHGKPLPVAYQQKPPQVPIEFRGLGVQMQSVGSVPMGNAPHVQPLFVHGAPPRAFQQQAVIQQGQGLGCTHPASHHLPQFGNMRIIKDLSQQQARSCNEQKRIVKITHPETHEELMLDRYVHSYGYMDIPVPGQIPLPGMNQLPQTVQTFSPFHKVYPLQQNIYNSTPFYLHKSNTVPFESRQISSKMQPARYSFDPTNSNRPIVPIKSPTPNPWLNVRSRPPTHSHASEVSSSKVILSSTLSAPGQGAQKLPTVFFAGKNEISSQTSTLCMTETPAVLRYSGESALPSQQRVHKNGLDISLEPEKVASEGNLKVPATTSGMSPTAVSAQQTQVVPAIAGHVTSVVKSKSAEIEKSPLSATASSSDAKSEPSNIVSLQSEAFEGTETSSENVHAILTEASLGYNNIDGTPLVARNSKCDGKSILGKPPLTHTQETLAPKCSTSRTITEGLSKANPIYSLEETSKTSSSVPLHIRDVAREEHIVNVEVKCSRTKEEQVNMNMASACGSENATDGNKLVKLHAHSESGDSLYPLVSIRDLPSSYKNKQCTSDTQTGVCEPENELNDSTLDSEMMLNNIAFINSTSSERKLMQENVDLEISNNCSAAASPPMALTKKTRLNFKDKTAYGRRKKRQEMFPKSDGQKCFDLSNASGSLNENPVSSSAQEDVQSSSTVDIDENCTLYADDTLTASSNVSQKPTDLLNSEDATDISTQRLGARGCKHTNTAIEVSKDKYECNHKKLYSRDFLLAFAPNCVNLPEGFKIGFDIADAIMSILVGDPYIVHTELHSNHARIKDRVSTTSRVNRHMASKSDEDKWRKHYLSPIPGRDTLPDTSGRPAFSSRDATQLAGHGSSRSLSQNHSSSSQYTGEILSRAMKEVVSQRSVSHGSVDERWQHRTNVQGISSASQISIPVMHKAEKKYEIGKVSDEEEAKQRQLKAILNKLTPQNFEKLFEQVKDLNIDNIVTLTGVISQIFDKALMEPTFVRCMPVFVLVWLVNYQILLRIMRKSPSRDYF